MQRTILATGIVATLGLAGLSAHAGCADPRSPGQHVKAMTLPAQVMSELSESENWSGGDAGDRIVGTWRVSYTVEGAPFADALIQWHRDGTEWENINLPVAAGNICMGSWKRVDRSHVRRSHIGWLYTDGIVSGYFTETETDKVSADGKSY